MTRPARWARRAAAAGALVGSTAVAAVAPSPAAASPAVLPHTSAASAYPIVGLAPTADSNGYWVAASNGGVFSYGDAVFHGSTGGVALARPVVGIASTHDGGGYWLVASDGGIFTFGDAPFLGSTGNVRLNQPIVGMAATPDGRGYWMVASDGGIFTFGDAPFYGSTGNVRLAQPIVAMTPTPDGHGYWLVASDGGIFSFGDARFYGSTGNVRLAKPVIGMADTPDGRGYWMVASDGGVFTFGDAAFHGSAVSQEAARGASAIGILPVAGGYWIPDNEGGVAAFASPQPVAPAAPVYQPQASQPSGSGAIAKPAASTAPSAATSAACFAPPVNAAACDAAALADINRARAGEGLGPLVLPANYASLPMTSQILAVANAERSSRGLAALPENVSLDSMAAAGARAGVDPSGPSGYSWGSNIAWGYPTALSADFSWMYDDGPGSPNVDCTSAGASGCWGHRDNILSPFSSGAAGAGVYQNGGTLQLTELFVNGY